MLHSGLEPKRGAALRLSRGEDRNEPGPRNRLLSEILKSFRVGNFRFTRLLPGLVAILVTVLALSACRREEGEREPVPVPQPIAETLETTPTERLAVATPRVPTQGPTRTPSSSPTASATPSEGSGVLEGRVIRLDTGAGVSGARVELRSLATNTSQEAPATSRETRTDSQGRFRFTIKPREGGVYSIEVKAPGLALLETAGAATSRITLQPGDHIEGFELVVFPGPTIRGVVTDAETGLPLPGVEILAQSPSGEPLGMARTDATGRYWLTGLASLNVELHASKEGYAPGVRSRPAVVEFPGLKTREVERDIRMTLCVEITGRATNESGAAVRNVRVSLVGADEWENSSSPVRTDAEGNFQVRAAPGTQFRLKAEAPGYAPAYSRFLDVRKSAAKNVVIRLQRGRVLTGTVVDPADRPIQGAEVKVYAELGMGDATRPVLMGMGETSASGAFRMEQVPETVMVITAGNASSRAAPQRIPPGREDLDLGAFVLAPTITIHGSVRNASGEVAAGCRVAVFPQGADEFWAAETFTDLEGRFHLPGVPVSTARIELDHPGFGSRQMYDVILFDGIELDLTLDRDRTYDVEGVVRDWKSGEPISDFTISCNVPDRSVFCDPGTPGTFRITNVPDDDVYSVWIKAGEYPLYQAFLRPSLADSVLAEYLAGPGGVVSGRVTDAVSGRPFSGVDVLLVASPSAEYGESAGSPVAETTTEASGEFRFDGVQGPRAWLLFQPPRLPIQDFRRVEIGHGQEMDLGEIPVPSR